jgi:hypothetical protein
VREQGDTGQRCHIVTARVEAEPGWGQLVALLEVAIAPTPLTSDERRATSDERRATSDESIV